MDSIKNDVELLLAILATENVNWKNIDKANELLTALLDSIEVVDGNYITHEDEDEPPFIECNCPDCVDEDLCTCNPGDWILEGWK